MNVYLSLKVILREHLCYQHAGGPLCCQHAGEPLCYQHAGGFIK